MTALAILIFDLLMAHFLYVAISVIVGGAANFATKRGAIAEYPDAEPVY